MYIGAGGGLGGESETTFIDITGMLLYILTDLFCKFRGRISILGGISL